MLSPTSPSTGIGGTLPRDFIENSVPRVGTSAMQQKIVYVLCHGSLNSE